MTTEPAAFAALEAETELRFLRAPWAPGLVLAFARWRGDLPALSPLSCGAGLTAAAARRRALGELAENLSIHAPAQPVPLWDARGQLVLADARARPDEGAANLGSEGCAAGPDMATARLAALCEGAERAALAMWWTGALSAGAAAPPGALAALRAGGPVARRCVTLALPMLAGLAVRLVVTDDGASGHLAMGSAAHPDPDRAAEAALRETLQAELAWLMPPDHPDLPERDLRAAGLAARLPDLLTAAPALPESRADALSDLSDALTAQGLDHGFADLTHPRLGIPVARFACPAWPRARPVFMAMAKS